MISVCFSGGAEGADSVFNDVALSNQHSVIHYSFEGHRCNVSDNIYRLNQDELKIADSALKKANKTLKRKIPFRSYVRNLLRRNFYQIEMVSSVYAVSTIKNGQISGGTAWACQMFIDRNFSFMNKIPLFVFDQDKRQWFQYDKHEGFVAIDKPPVPSGMYAGIGTRDLNDFGKEAIKNAYNA